MSYDERLRDAALADFEAVVAAMFQIVALAVLVAQLAGGFAGRRPVDFGSSDRSRSRHHRAAR